MFKKLLLIGALLATYNTKVSALDDETVRVVSFIATVTGIVALRLAIRYVVTKAVDKAFDKKEERKA